MLVLIMFEKINRLNCRILISSKKQDKTENFLLTNCDVISEINYRSLLDFHIKNKADLTIAVKKYISKNNYGEIITKGIRVSNIIEKPKNDIIINSGIYVLNQMYKVFKIWRT